MTPGEQEAYHELQCYTLTHGDPAFIHQYVVDAWMAQHADAGTKPIGITFALVGLYLHLEHGFTGRAVQLAHMKLGRTKQRWPPFVLPSDRGAMTARDVMAAPTGPARDRAIDAWAASVWAPFQGSRPTVAALLRQHGVI
jgi:hypothetical protein